MECEISPEPFAEAALAVRPYGAVPPAVAVGVYSGGRLDEGAAALDERTGGAIARAVAGRGAPEPGSARVLPDGVLAERIVLAVALGERTELTPERLRRAAAALARAARPTATAVLHVELLGADSGLPPALCAQALIEGFGLAWDAARREDGDDRRLRLVLHGPAAALITGSRRGQTLLSAQVAARDLASSAGPRGDDLVGFARRAEEALRAARFDSPRREEAGSALTLRAGRPAPDPRDARGTLLLAGRGRTGEGAFGLSGPAAAVAAARAMAELRLPVAIEVLLQIEETPATGAPDGRADPVGRFVASLAERPGARLLHVASDLAGADVALGPEMAVMMAGDAEMGEALQGAGAAAGEPCWPLPADPAYLCPDPEGRARAVRAGMRAQVAAGPLPWCHLDVSAACRATSPYHPRLPGVANGFGARTLTLCAEALARRQPGG